MGKLRVNGPQLLLEKTEKANGYSLWKNSRVGLEWFARYIFYVMKDGWWVRLWY